MKTIVVLASLVLVMAAIIWTLQRRLIYFPFGQVSDPAAMRLSSVTAVMFPTADGLMLHGWFVGSTDQVSLTAIVFNGNAGNRAYRAPLAGALARIGVAVLLFDYRGFGGNPGSPSERGLTIDARAAHDYVIGRGGDPRGLVYIGESLGAAVATALAVEHPPAALILRSPFTSLAAVGQVHYRFLPVRWLLRDRFATIDRIQRVHAPLLVIAGDRDGIVPISQSREVFEKANEPKSLLVIPGADHNDASLLDGRDMIEGIAAFLTALEKPATMGSVRR